MFIKLICSLLSFHNTPQFKKARGISRRGNNPYRGLDLGMLSEATLEGWWGSGEVGGA